MKLDQERMAHNIAMTFAKLESEAHDCKDPQRRFQHMLEHYCAAYGYVMSQTPQTVEALTRAAVPSAF